MMTRNETRQAKQKARDMMDDARGILDGLLAWGELNDSERDCITRAVNLAGWAVARVNGCQVKRAPVTLGHAKLL